MARPLSLGLGYCPRGALQGGLTIFCQDRTIQWSKSNDAKTRDYFYRLFSLWSDGILILSQGSLYRLFSQWRTSDHTPTPTKPWTSCMELSTETNWWRPPLAGNLNNDGISPTHHLSYMWWKRSQLRSCSSLGETYGSPLPLLWQIRSSLLSAYRQKLKQVTPMTQIIQSWSNQSDSALHHWLSTTELYVFLDNKTDTNKVIDYIVKYINDIKSRPSVAFMGKFVSI